MYYIKLTNGRLLAGSRETSQYLASVSLCTISNPGSVVLRLRNFAQWQFPPTILDRVQNDFPLDIAQCKGELLRLSRENSTAEWRKKIRCKGSLRSSDVTGQSGSAQLSWGWYSSYRHSAAIIFPRLTVPSILHYCTA